MGQGMEQKPDIQIFPEVPRSIYTASQALVVHTLHEHALSAFRKMGDIFPKRKPVDMPVLEGKITGRFTLSLLRKLHDENALKSLPSVFASPTKTAKMHARITDDLWDWIKERNISDGFSHDAPIVPDPSRKLLVEYDEVAKDALGMKSIDLFARVRNAKYVDINRTNIHDYLPRIRASYERAWLTAKSLEKLSHNNADEIAAFCAETAKGVFVYGFDEKVGDASVEEQMVGDLTSENDPNDFPAYKCKALEDEKGELLAWLTYWQPPLFRSNGSHRESVVKYLHNGVTGGDMHFGLQPTKESFLMKPDKVLLFDTLRGEVSTAAARLFAKSVQDMIDHCSYIEDFITYRIRELFTEPRFQAYNATKRFCENTKSEIFFNARGCIDIARDFNPDGPKSQRVMENGTVVTLNPEWDVLSSEIRELFRRSKAIWNAIQLKNGDPTSDGLDDRFGVRKTY